MRAKGGAKRGVVGQQVFANRRRWQRHGGFDRLFHLGEQGQLGFDAGHRPARPVPITGQTAQGTGVGQVFAGTNVQSGALAEVVDIAE